MASNASLTDISFTDSLPESLVYDIGAASIAFEIDRVFSVTESRYGRVEVDFGGVTYFRSLAEVDFRLDQELASALIEYPGLPDEVAVLSESFGIYTRVREMKFGEYPTTLNVWKSGSPEPRTFVLWLSSMAALWVATSCEIVFSGTEFTAETGPADPWKFSPFAGR